VVFLDVAKPFVTVWVEGILYELTLNNFPSYPVKTISSYLQYRTFQVTFQSATSTCRGMRALVAQGGIVSPVRFCLYVNDMQSSRQVQLALYADDTALVAKFHSPSLIVNYVKSYLCRLEHWLQDWMISINVSKNRAMLFTMRRVQNPGQFSFSESQQRRSKWHDILV